MATIGAKSQHRVGCVSAAVGAAIMMFLGVGCVPYAGSVEGGDEQRLGVQGDRMVRDLQALIVRQDLSPAIDLYDAQRVRDYVSEKISAGDFRGIRQLVARPGTHEREGWYEVLAMHFASEMSCCRCRPVVLEDPLRGVEDAVAATKTLAQFYQGGPGAPDGREVRVRAAMAVRSDDPKLAIKVLLGEYARFAVHPDDIPPSSQPMRCSGVLRELGRSLPDEITSVADVRFLLALAGVQANPEDRGWELKSRLAATGSAFNRDLGSLLREGDRSRLEQLSCTPERARLIAELYRNAKPSIDGQVFR